MRELIERLKDKSKAQPFCLRSSEEQAALTAAGFHNTLYLTRELKWEQPTGGPPTQRDTYILKPDYKPEYIDREVVVEEIVTPTLRIEGTAPQTGYTAIGDLPEDPSFVGFYEDLNGTFRKISLEEVASSIRDGIKVIARFVR